MHEPTTGTLRVPGAQLYYEVRGSGPVLLLIPTGNGDAGPFAPLAGLLAERYRVITYDRRGFSRSPVDGPVDDGLRLSADVDDVHALLEHLADEPAFVYGTCTGAIVALAVLERSSARVRAVVAHEPPLVTLLPEADEELAFHDSLYDTYREHGIAKAFEMFKQYLGIQTSTKPPPEFQPPPDELTEMLTRIRGNDEFWLEHEIRTFPAVEPDLVALKASCERLTLVGGDDSHGLAARKATVLLAEQIGLELATFPGGHLSQVTHPVEVAAGIDALLARWRD